MHGGGERGSNIVRDGARAVVVECSSSVNRASTPSARIWVEQRSNETVGLYRKNNASLLISTGERAEQLAYCILDGQVQSCAAMVTLSSTW